MHDPKISGERVFLAPVAPEDAALWAKWLNDPEVTLPLGDEAYILYGAERAQMDVRETAERQGRVFTILENESGRAIGRCLLFDVNLVDRSAMAGIFIGEKDCRGKGYGRESMRLLLDFGFNLLNLHSIMLGVFAFNEPAIRCYRSLGFQEIGRRRDARWICGKAYDGILMDLLEDEFRARFASVVRV
ncbi:acetyltransferase [Longilinea arvoryzae]|uniref:Acetyltransferase n=1 Tax=Longilinea arvoryzae TaxID=360412 RepID=A0A0S7BP09_9CHLR|nr:GNAT family protein [Longilinea arvoryzae]GAP15541.1 acetyltransferase [Longilinea arvoryzae]